MPSEDELQEARSEAEAILTLSDEALTKLFFDVTMRRNLSRTVRHLDRLVRSGASDRELGKAALERLGFSAEL